MNGGLKMKRKMINIEKIINKEGIQFISKLPTTYGYELGLINNYDLEGMTFNRREYERNQSWEGYLVPINRGSIPYEKSIHTIIENNVTNGLGFHDDIFDFDNGDYREKLKLYEISTDKFDYKQATLDLIDEVLNDSSIKDYEKIEILEPILNLGKVYSNERLKSRFERMN